MCDEYKEFEGLFEKKVVICNCQCQIVMGGVVQVMCEVQFIIINLMYFLVVIIYDFVIVFVLIVLVKGCGEKVLVMCEFVVEFVVLVFEYLVFVCLVYYIMCEWQVICEEFYFVVVGVFVFVFLLKCGECLLWFEVDVLVVICFDVDGCLDLQVVVQSVV